MPFIWYFDMQIAEVSASAPPVLANAKISGGHDGSAIPAPTLQAVISASHDGSLVAMATVGATLTISAREP